MNPFTKISKRASEIDQYDILATVLRQPEIKGLIVNLNTRQLERGEKVNGDIIGLYKSFPYASFKQGLPGRQAKFGFVDLRLTGQYYRSFNVEVLPSGDFIIDSNPIKDGKNLIEIYGPGIEGLSDSSLNILVNAIKSEYVKQAKKRLFQ